MCECVCVYKHSKAAIDGLDSGLGGLKFFGLNCGRPEPKMLSVNPQIGLELQAKGNESMKGNQYW